LSLYTSTVIVSFKHKGLKRLFEQNDRSGLRADLTDKIERILTVLDAASAPQALDLPGYRPAPAQRRSEGILVRHGARQLADCFPFRK